MSSTIHVPDTEEIHRIAYLTVHGWDYVNYSGFNNWSKDGFTRTEHDRHGNPYEESNYDLETAYYAQYEAAP